MTAKLLDSIVSRYLESYKDSIDAVPLDEKSITISFPFHYSADHRIELTVTESESGRFVISDAARTLAELRDAGYSVGQSAKERLEKIAANSGITLVNNYLVLECDKKTLGDGIQTFLEAAKTIADVYLVHSRPRTSPEDDLTNEVRKILNKNKVLYRENDKLQGELEVHSVNFYVPPNGLPGLALSILAASNSHLVAEAWGFKADDIRKTNPKTKIGLVYDSSGKWTDDSKRILDEKSDIAVPGDKLATFEEKLPQLGIVKSLFR